MKSKRFYLKEIQDTDLENIHKGLSNPEITQYYDVHFDTLEETKMQMQWYNDLRNNDTGIWWGVYETSSNEFVGAGGFNDHDKKHRRAEIGFWLLKEHWGKGIMPEVMPLICSFGFDQMNLNRIEGFVISDNNKCKKAMEKINFHYEGTWRDYEFKNGNFISVDTFSLLKND